MSPAPQIAGRVTAMSEPASMAYPSVDLNLNYKLLNRGTEERGEEGEGEGDIYRYGRTDIGRIRVEWPRWPQDVAVGVS